MWVHFQLVNIIYSGNLKYARCKLCHDDPLSETQIQHLRQKREENRECGHREARLYGCIIGRKRDMCRHLKNHCQGASEGLKSEAEEILQEMARREGASSQRNTLIEQPAQNIGVQAAPVVSYGTGTSTEYCQEFGDAGINQWEMDFAFLETDNPACQATIPPEDDLQLLGNAE